MFKVNARLLPQEKINFTFLIAGQRIWEMRLTLIFLIIYFLYFINKRNSKRFNNRVYSLFLIMSIFLKHLWLIPNILKWQPCKIFTKLAPSPTPSRRSHRKCFVKKGVLKVSQEDAGAGFFFNKVAGLKAYNFIKSRLQHRCFPVKFCKFLRTLNLRNICERLLLPSWRHCVLYNNIIKC